MRIALLSDGVYPYVIGGMQKHSYNLLKYLSLQGHDVIVYHSLSQKDELPILIELESESGKIKIVHRAFHFPKLDRFPGHYLRESYLLSQLYRERLLQEEAKFDLIYAQGFMGWALFKEGKGKITAPIIVNFHGLEMFQKAATLKMKLEHYLLRPAVKYNLAKADKVVSLGGKLTDLLSHLGYKDKTLINSIGIESHWLEKNDCIHSPRRFVFIGRNERRKGIQELNQAIEELEVIEFEFHIIGPFTQKDMIGDRRVKYYGEISNEEKIAEVLTNMDVLVLPSWSEGMPTVILEAMAKSCAIIASDVGAVSELVSSQNGWLCEAGNVTSLKQTIVKAVNVDEVTLISLKEYSYKRVKEHYTWDNVIQRLLDKIKI